jgi:uncharacterized protein
MVFGGPILEDIFKAFAAPIQAQQVIDRYTDKYSVDTVQRIIADLSREALLVEDPRVDVRTYRREYYKALNQYHIQHLYFLPTNACNFRCTYCFVEDDQRNLKPSYMDIPIAQMVLDTFARLSQEAGHASVTFYGGEPLLNPKVTFYALRRLRQLEEEERMPKLEPLSLLTNGSLIDGEAVREFQETRPNISVSIDGPQMLHDAARIDQCGRGTFAAALRGYRLLQDGGLRPGISCTLNTLTIEHMDEIADFIINDLKPIGMGFNLLLPQSSSPPSSSSFDHEFAVHQLIRAFTRLRAAGIYEDRMMRRVRPFLSHQMHCKDCMGVGGQIVVTPAGRVGPCQAFLGVDDQRFFPLDIRELAAKGEQVSASDIYSNALFGEWCQRFPLNMEQCAECFAISVCGGGCPYAALVTDGSIWKIDQRVCFQAKNILPWMIWDTYENMKAEEPAAPSGIGSGQAKAAVQA